SKATRPHLHSLDPLVRALWGGARSPCHSARPWSPRGTAGRGPPRHAAVQRDRSCSSRSGCHDQLAPRSKAAVCLQDRRGDTPLNGYESETSLHLGMRIVPRLENEGAWSEHAELDDYSIGDTCNLDAVARNAEWDLNGSLSLGLDLPPVCDSS